MFRRVRNGGNDNGGALHDVRNSPGRPPTASTPLRNDPSLQSSMPPTYVRTITLEETADSTTYTGDYVDGKRHGPGTLTLSNGDVFEGLWREGKQHGPGSLRRFDDGFAYKGEFENNQMHGYGVMNMDNGTTYEGEWRDNVMNGLGVSTSADGIVYEGQFVNGKCSGYGRKYRSRPEDGAIDSYTGEWLHGKYHGKGTIRYADGDIYEGSFQNNRAHGTGIFTVLDGTVFEGEFQDGKAQGEGVERFPCGDTYVGTFVRGKRNGWGTFTLAETDTSMTGYSSDGVFEGNIEINYRSGLQISAIARNGLQMGNARLVFPDGLRVQGNLIQSEDRMTGVVKVEDIDGRVAHVDLDATAYKGELSPSWFRNAAATVNEISTARASLLLLEEAIQDAHDEKKRETAADVRRRKKERHRQRRLHTEREEEQRRRIERELREQGEREDRTTEADVRLRTAMYYAQQTYDAHATRQGARDALQRLRRALEVNHEASEETMEDARALRSRFLTQAGRLVVSKEAPPVAVDTRKSATRAQQPATVDVLPTPEATVIELAADAHTAPDNVAGSELCCPITLEMFQDPVMTINGNTYERGAIEEWFASRPHPEDPLTGSRLESGVLIPNHALRRLIAMQDHLSRSSQ